MILRSTLAALALALAATTATAHHTEEHGEQAEAPAIGPVIGAAAPALSVIGPDGAAPTLESLSGTNGTIIAFVRSADWCPFCKRQLVELSGAVANLEATGWQLAGLSYDAPDTLTAFASASDISYPLLSDEGSTTIKAFGLLNEEHAPDSRVYGIPHPALVFIRNDGTVAAVLREDGYRTRPTIELIQSTIANLANTSDE